MERKAIIKSLKDKRYTFQQIGNFLGISRQRAHQILTGYNSPFAKKKLKEIKQRALQKQVDIKNGLRPDTKGIKLEGFSFIREAIRRRDNYTCQICGKKWKKGQRRFDVHHIDCDKEKTNKYDNWEKEKDNMITLCHKCHLNLPEHREAMADAKKKK